MPHDRPYERDSIARLAAYTPGEQPASRDVVKLNTNENPYPPSVAVLQAIRTIDGESLRRYPPPNAAEFRKAAAQVHGVTPEQVIATNGGDELLRMVVAAFCEPCGERGEGGLGVAEPSYSLYPVLAATHNTPIVRVPLGPAFDLPQDLAQRWNDAGCRLAVLVNPHAPSGRLESVEALRSVAERFRGVLVIDEAYVDFASHDALPLVREGLPNVLLLRTLSKGYSLAGLRLGYGVGHAGLVATLDKTRDSYNTDILAQRAAVAALASRDDAARSWAAVISERQRLSRALVARGFDVLPSQSNFILATPPAQLPPARAMYLALKERGVFVRYFDQDRLRERLRITVGTPAQNDRFLSALDEVARA